MSQENLPKGYEPSAVEQQWRDHWELNKTFTPEMPAKSAPYSIVIPPPNVTGNLHIGHALNLTLQDILCRHARQRGHTVLWVPGYDHAGIATQNVVERRLAADEGKSRDDLGREAFLERVWQWKEEYGARITRQVKAMGCSVDWTRERFTMDEGLSRAVRKVFVGLYKQGLVYKGDYIVNWCTRCHTALADDEVDHVPQKTKLWFFNYPLEDGSGHITIATVRPETILGDVAVAVHPEDERYRDLVGKNVILPILNRPIPIIADSYVDREFGSGAVKITPAHDLNDWYVCERHGLEVVQVIDDEGLMNEKAGPYAGLPKVEARARVAAEFERLGLLVKVEDYENSIGLCYRCKEIIEPHISTQWFVSMRPLAAKARAAVPSETRLFPETWLKTYYHWLDTVRDWCVSRQIWWGHRIPAWTCAGCGDLMVEEEAPDKCAKCGCAELEQDPDVLDTWFSSALWPFSTLGWPEQTEDLKTFYPTSVLVTGFDILFFWVARMMMLGLQFMHKVPFDHVYIHALVRDAEGRKMSKSIGNVIDPLEMIGKYGTDALRFTLTAFAAMGRDIRLSEERIEGYRHFVNKIWNASRFALMNMPEDGKLEPVDLGRVEGVHHQWILHRLEEVKAETLKSIETYRFNDYAQGLYKFIWTELCDWYLELIKTDMQAGGEKQAAARYVLSTVLGETLTLLHPVMPFVTAEVWAALPGRRGTDLALEPFPPARPACLKPEAAARMNMVQEAIVAVRTIRAELNIAPSLRLKAIIRPQDETAAGILEDQRAVIEALARLGELVIDARAEVPRLAANQVAGGNEIIVPLEGAVDFEAEKVRLDKELVKLEKELAMLSGKLANSSYVEKAPPHLVERDRARVDELKDAGLKLRQVRARFE